MINKVGISSIKNNSNSKSRNGGKSKSSNFITGRVTDIILNENHPQFTSYGNLNSIGLIFFEVIGPGNVGTIKTAKPQSPSSKIYPLIGELVTCFTAPIPILNNSNTYKNEYYYSNSLNLWNSPHHNASPNPRNNIQPNTEKLNYQQIEAGLTKTPPSTPTEIDLNSPFNPSQNTFIERSNIHPLMPFMGDLIYEGRFGQSLRFGNTSKTDSQYKNNWSNNGEDGNPITILRNGQPTESSNEGWIPITENLNNDLSSIYLTSTQKLPFSIANENFTSYSTPPIVPANYINPQIILNSDRIVLNAKQDNILISGEQSVGISSNQSINLEANDVYIDSTDIRLGDKNAIQPVLKGNDTVEYLKIVIREIANLATALKTIQIYTGPNIVGVPDPSIQPVAKLAALNLEEVLEQLDSIKSNFVKTI